MTYTENNDNPFPFHSITNSDFETLNYENRLSDNDKNRLSQIKFDPFHLNERIARSENNINLDTSFNTNDMNCDYFLPNEVGNKIKSPNNQIGLNYQNPSEQIKLILLLIQKK
jgi:hypothetical protein